MNERANLMASRSLNVFWSLIVLLLKAQICVYLMKKKMQSNCWQQNSEPVYGLLKWGSNFFAKSAS